MSKLDLDCFNCGGPMSARLRYPFLFCSEPCRQTAKAVRYGRAVSRDGRMEEPDVKEAVRIKLAFAVGGYPESERRVSPELRAVIVARDGGRCRSCDEPGTEVDHIGSREDGDLNDPHNLQLLCSTCHRAKTLDSLRPATPEEQGIMEALLERISAAKPMRICDDEGLWGETWREHARQRRAQFARTRSARKP